MDAPIGGEGDDASKTIADMLESEESWDDHSKDDVIMLVQSYINRNKIVEAILIDNIAFNDVQRYHKKTIKTDTGKYTDVSSEFWPYRLVQIVSKLPETYKREFLAKYKISEEKLDSVLAYVDKTNNQRIYKLLDRTLAELRTSYAAI
jgi:Zn-dependent peptidase ImmA (M78 family)